MGTYFMFEIVNKGLDLPVETIFVAMVFVIHPSIIKKHRNRNVKLYR